MCAVRERVKRLNDANAAHTAYMEKLQRETPVPPENLAEQKEALTWASTKSRGTDVDMRLLKEVKNREFLRAVLDIFATPNNSGVSRLRFREVRLLVQRLGACLLLSISELHHERWRLTALIMVPMVWLCYRRTWL